MKTFWSYESLVESNVWDKTWHLPLCPINRNPHLYAGYAVRILDSVGEKPNADVIRANYRSTYLKACEKAPGLITTKPGEEAASHDDAYGAAFLDSPRIDDFDHPVSNFAGRCIDYLSRSDGAYGERKTFYRFPFFLPAMKAFAGFQVAIFFSQISYVISLLYHAWTTKDGDTSGHLKLWMTFPEMHKYRLTSAYIDWWAEKWTVRGITPKKIFEKSYLTECPWFAENARNDWK